MFSGWWIIWKPGYLMAAYMVTWMKVYINTWMAPYNMDTMMVAYIDS